MALNASDITNFLFDGQAPPSVTTYGTTQTNIPQFMTDYTLGLLNKANAVMAEPYQPYGGQRIQGFTPEQLKAQQLTSQSVGQFMPDITQGQDITKGSLQYNAANAAQPYMQKAFGIDALALATPNLQRASAIDALGLASPNIQKAAAIDALGLASPNIQKAAAINALGISQPYAQKAGGTFTGEAVNQYMNPYIGGVVNRLGDLAARNLREKFMPQISADFIRSGTYGSAGQQAAVGQALRDVQESALAAQNQALAEGYKTSADIFSSDLGRQLQLAQQQGNLALGQQQNLGQLGQSLGNLGLGQQQNLGQLGQIIGNLGLGQQQNLGQLGQIMGNLGLGQQQNLGALGQIAGNMASQTARDQLAAASQLANIGQMGQGMNLKDLAALEAVGAAQQAQKQKSLDLAYQDYLTQRDYPYTQLQRMNELIRGLPMSKSTSASESAPLSGAGYGPSMMSILTALSKMGGFAEGGQVKRNPNRRSTRGRKRR